MSTLITSTKKVYWGPFFITTEAMEELDKTLSSVEGKMKEFFLPNNYNEFKCTVRLSDRNDRMYEDTSIIKILKDEGLQSFEPIKLSVYIGSRPDNEFELKIESKNGEDISVSLGIKDINCKQEIIYVIDKWVAKYSQSYWLKIWEKFQISISLLIFFGIYSFFILIYSSSNPYAQNINIKANQLINSGITSQNINLAVELLLRKNFGIYSTKPIILNDKYVIWYPLIILIGLLVLAFKPKTIIGIGRNTVKMKLMLSWTKILMISIPTYFILPIIYEILKSVLLK